MKPMARSPVVDGEPEGRPGKKFSDLVVDGEAILPGQEVVSGVDGVAPYVDDAGPVIRPGLAEFDHGAR
ncbi:hypothetical protein, partial [Brevundimonas sp.]|uniref:hypothetical protein n=1 Tax=Brevundimonas sp. TaxID=1871086 RepID=UPI002D2BD97B